MNAEHIISTVDHLHESRRDNESQWEEVRKYVFPRKGEKKSEALSDTTAVRANEKLASGLLSWMCPLNQRWFALKPRSNELTQVEDVMRYFEDVTKIMAEKLAGSNFGLETEETFLDLGSIGTACLSIDADENGDLFFRSYHISTFYITENIKGTVDTIFRRFKYTAKQAVSKWGYDALGPKLKDAYDKSTFENPSELNKEYSFIHAVFPREERDKGKIDNKNMPFVSLYISEEDKEIIEEGGCHEFPYAVVRFMKNNRDIYGSSPAIGSLPDIKTINNMKEIILKVAQKKLNPPFLVPDDGMLSMNFRTTPGALNYYRPGVNQSKPEPINLGSDINDAKEIIEEAKRDIYSAFYLDLFELLIDKKNMTATEVLERAEEKIDLFSPKIARLQEEFFRPLILRCFGILMRSDILPSVPFSVSSDQHYEVEYISKMALGLKAVEARAFVQTINLLGPAVQMNPAIIDNFNLDLAARDIGLNTGMKTSWINSQEKVIEIRQQREAAQQMEQLGDVADKIPKLSGKVDPSSVLGSLQNTESEEVA